MNNTSRRPTEKGYILLDVLMALFIFSLGFAALWGLSHYNRIHGAETQNLMTAVNLASSRMDEAIIELKDQPLKVNTYLNGVVEESTDPRYDLEIKTGWGDMEGIVHLSVAVQWRARTMDRLYRLENYIYVGE